MIKAENERLVSDIEKLKSRLREEINRTQASVRLDLNLEKGRMREESAGQQLKIKEVDTRIEQEIAALRTSIQASKATTLQFIVGTGPRSRYSHPAVYLPVLCSDWSICSTNGLSTLSRISLYCFENTKLYTTLMRRRFPAGLFFLPSWRNTTSLLQLYHFWTDTCRFLCLPILWRQSSLATRMSTRPSMSSPKEQTCLTMRPRSSARSTRTNRFPMVSPGACEI